MAEDRVRLSLMFTGVDGEFESDAERNACYALTYLKQVSASSDRDLAEVLGCSRPSVIKRRQGKQPLTLTDIEALAAAFNVPVTLFLMSPDEVRTWLAVNWSTYDGAIGLKKYFASLAA